jgi:hypothetical protein
MTLTIELVKNAIVDILKNAMLTLPEKERLVVEIPDSVDNYKLNHPRGAVLVVYRGSNYIKKNINDFLAQDRDIEIGVIVIARNIKSIANNSMSPDDYLDFVIDKLSGQVIDNKREEKKIYCKGDEFVDEENGVWTYLATFVVPIDFFEEDIRGMI